MQYFDYGQRSTYTYLPGERVGTRGGEHTCPERRYMVGECVEDAHILAKQLSMV